MCAKGRRRVGVVDLLASDNGRYWQWVVAGVAWRYPACGGGHFERSEPAGNGTWTVVTARVTDVMEAVAYSLGYRDGWLSTDRADLTGGS